MAADSYDVALFNPGDQDHNTIVLGGVDLVIPLELDIDGDPFQDDAVCLRSHGGHWEHALTSADPEVTAAPDKRHLYYPFHDVPAGLYHLDVLIAGQWTSVASNILVSRGEAWLGSRRLTGAVPDSIPARAGDDRTPEPAESHAADCGCCS
jgi:hypothetical protein